jgi:hypothetical protein
VPATRRANSTTRRMARRLDDHLEGARARSSGATKPRVPSLRCIARLSEHDHSARGIALMIANRRDASAHRPLDLVARG